MIFVGVAHSGLCHPLSGYWAALFALFTAYVGMFGQALGVGRQFGAAAVFYVMYAAGTVYLAVLPALPSGGTRLALLNGAILGGLAYGTYVFTNYAVLKGWTVTLVIADVAWGIVLTAVTAACGLFVARLGS